MDRSHAEQPVGFEGGREREHRSRSDDDEEQHDEAGRHESRVWLVPGRRSEAVTASNGVH